MLFPETWTYWPVQLFSLSKHSSIIYTDIVPFLSLLGKRPESRHLKLHASCHRGGRCEVARRGETSPCDSLVMADDIYTHGVFPGLQGKTCRDGSQQKALSLSLSPFVSLWQAGSPAELHALQEMTIWKVWLHIRGAVSRFLGFTFQVSWCKKLWHFGLVGINIKDYYPGK